MLTHPFHHFKHFSWNSVDNFNTVIARAEKHAIGRDLKELMRTNRGEMLFWKSKSTEASKWGHKQTHNKARVHVFLTHIEFAASENDANFIFNLQTVYFAFVKQKQS